MANCCSTKVAFYQNHKRKPRLQDERLSGGMNFAAEAYAPAFLCDKIKSVDTLERK